LELITHLLIFFLQVDNYPIATDLLGSIGDQILDAPKYLFIGNNSKL